MNGGTCTEPKPCGFTCVCLQSPIAYYGAVCESKGVLTVEEKKCIYSAIETQYFTGTQLGLLRFVDIQNNILQAYQQANAANICPTNFKLVGSSCYRLDTSYLYDWTQAQSNCIAIKAELASFANIAELNQVRSWLSSISLIPKNIWTDGRFIGGRWVWNTNSVPISVDLLSSLSSSANAEGLLLDRSNNYYLTNGGVNVRGSYVLCKTKPFSFDTTTVSFNLISQQTAITAAGQPALGLKYQINVTESDKITSVSAPSSTTYSAVHSSSPIQYGQYYNDKVYPYDNPFVVTLCDELTGGQIEQARVAIKNRWLAVRPELATCNCFNVFIVSSDKYVDTNNKLATRLVYIGKANDILYETTSSGTIPGVSDIYNVLSTQYGFSQCTPRVKRSSTLEIVTQECVSSNVVRDSIKAIRQDLAGKLLVTSVAQSDAIDTTGNKAVSVCSFDVKINGNSLNFLSQTDIDPERLIEELNYQNPNNVITLSDGVYSRNYFFTLFSKIELSKQQYSTLTEAIKSVFLKEYTQFSAYNVTVSIPLQEEYVDSSRSIIYGLSVLIKIDKQPVDDIIALNRKIFNSIQTPQQVATFFIPTDYVIPLSKAISFYSNLAITHDNKAKLETLVKNMFEATLPSYKDQLSVILASQKIYTLKDGKKYWKLSILPNIKNTGNVLAFTESTSDFVSTLSKSINFNHPSGETYKVYSTVQDTFDLSMHHSAVIVGKIAAYDRESILDSVKLAWASAVQQTSVLNNEWSKGLYDLVFVDSDTQMIDVNNKLYTKITYFVRRNKVPVKPINMEALPRFEWIEIKIREKNLPYKSADPTALSNYDSFYAIDLLGFIDVLHHSDISSIIKSEFSSQYDGKSNYPLILPKNHLNLNLSLDLNIDTLKFVFNERRVGEFGNNVTRLLYSISSTTVSKLDTNIYAAPTESIIDSLAEKYVVYSEVSYPLSDYFVAVVQNWVDRSSKSSLENQYAKAMEAIIYGSSDVSSTSGLKASIEITSKYVSGEQQTKYSRIYMKLVTKDTNVLIPPINIQSSDSAIAARTAEVTSNYIYKVRTIFIENITPELKNQNFGVLENVISSAWDARLAEHIEMLPIKSILTGKKFTTTVNSIQRYLSKQDKFMYKVEYIVAIMNRDPEFLGVLEPTYNNYIAAFASAKTDIKLCSCFGVENTRVYINGKAQAINGVLSNILTSLWNQQNSLNQITNDRISFKFTSNDNYYNQNGDEISRLSVTWIVDNDDPSQIYFTRPTADAVTKALAAVNLQVYTDIPYKSFVVYFNNFNETNANLIPNLLTKAWQLSNLKYGQADFAISNVQRSLYVGKTVSSAKATLTSR